MPLLIIVQVGLGRGTQNVETIVKTARPARQTQEIAVNIAQMDIDTLEKRDREDDAESR